MFFSYKRSSPYIFLRVRTCEGNTGEIGEDLKKDNLNEAALEWD